MAATTSASASASNTGDAAPQEPTQLRRKERRKKKIMRSILPRPRRRRCLAITVAGEDDGASGSSPLAPMLAVPLVTVPYFVAPPAMLHASAVTGQFAMSHQAFLAIVTTQAQMQLQARLNPPISNHFPLTPVPIQQQPTPTPMESTSPSTTSSAAEKQRVEVTVAIPGDDGYNWRKYGQKQVKGRGSFRSYYRCTQLTCSAKRKVERLADGCITDVTYQGEHNHEPPTAKAKAWRERVVQCSRRSDDQNEAETEDRRASRICEGNEGMKVEDDVAGADAKSRVCGSSEALSTPMESVGSDGYRWRKYGEKNIKGSPHPRSYYRCTHTGCPVRKHVEKVSDTQSVVITYGVKHIHSSLPSSRALPLPTSSTEKASSGHEGGTGEEASWDQCSDINIVRVRAQLLSRQPS